MAVVRLSKGRRKGMKAEEIVLKALQQLKGELKIRGFKKMGNAPGKDFTIYLSPGGDPFPIEIKCSLTGAIAHQRRYNETETPCLVVNLKNSHPSSSMRKRRIRRVKRDISELLKGLEKQSKMAGG